ncbi:MAG: Gfo/Idh/MocA family oxidoreductase [Candidatus Thermoplasmatota archaeon]|nr:Gfo/Idh/MocA family oxidoreductase [Candidatus Thermoplasmatota archaeon]
MTSIIKIGIIGYGKMGKIRKKEIEKNPQLSLVGICDQNINSNKLSDIKYYQNYLELLNDKIDAVFVCTPNKFTPDIVIAALKKNKHVFCEKPPGRTLEDVYRIAKVKEKHKNLILKFGFNHRYHDNIIEAKSIIDSGRYGNILWIRGIYGKSGGSDFKDIWRSKREIAGGGILLDQGIHMIDLFRLFCGDFQEVKSIVTNNPWKLDVENDAFALLRNNQGQIALLHSSSTQWKHTFSLEISLEKGYINLYGILSSTRSYGQGERLVTAKRQFENETPSVGNPPESVTYYNDDKSWELEINEFATCIIENKVVQVGTLQDAIMAMELVDKIYKADLKWMKKMNLLKGRKNK